MGAVVRRLSHAGPPWKMSLASRILGDVKRQRPTLRPTPVDAPAAKGPRKALRELDADSLRQVVGGITANDDWEAPVV